jgi:hypothetical protein
VYARFGETRARAGRGRLESLVKLRVRVVVEADGVEFVGASDARLFVRAGRLFGDGDGQEVGGGARDH